MDRGNDYMLLLGVHSIQRERAITAAFRCFPGKIVAIIPNGKICRIRYLDEVLDGNPYSETDALRVVYEYQRITGGKPVAVVPFSEMTLFAGANIARAFDLPYLSDDCLQAARHKARMKDQFFKHGLPAPTYANFCNFKELKDCIIKGKFEFPVVLKPVNLGGSEGVILVSEWSELTFAFRHLESILQKKSAIYEVSNPVYQIEEFVEAPYEISVEVLNTTHGRFALAVADKALGERPFFKEMGHSIPSIFSHVPSYKTLAIRACEALDIQLGLAHVEMRIKNDGEARLMEVGARTAGDGIMDLVERVFGFNPYELHIKCYLGQHVDVPQLSEKGQAAMVVLKAPPGIISDIRIDPELSQLPNLHSLEITAKVGQMSETGHSSHAQEGYAEFFWLCKDQNRNTANTEHLVLAKKLTDRIFTVKPVKD